MIANVERLVKMPLRRVEPRFHLRLNGRKQLRQRGRRFFSGLADTAFGAYAPVIHRAAHLDVMHRAVGGLHGQRAADAYTRHGHVLVPREHDVEAKLFAEPPGLVFFAVGQQRAGLQIALKAAVIDTDRHVDVAANGLQRPSGGRNRRFNDQLVQRLATLPDSHVERANADQADAQPVLQRMNGVRPDGQPPRFIADVRAKADGVQIFEVCAEFAQAEVEIVVAQRDVLIPHRVHRLRDGMRAQAETMLIVRKRRPLQGVASVDDERVFAAFKRGGELEEPHRLFRAAGVIGRVEVTVCIGRVIDSEVFHLLFFICRWQACGARGWRRIR